MMKYAYVGCRTSLWRNARGQGIEVFCLDHSGRWKHVQRIESVQENPSWLTLDPIRNRLYVLHGDGDRVAIYNRNPENGHLTLLSDQTTGPRHTNPELDPLRRNNPVGSALTPQGEVLLIANHEGGNIAALPVTQNGLLAPMHLALVPGHPSSKDAKTLSRPHEIVFAPQSPFFAVPVQGREAGKGIDMMRLYRWHPSGSHLCDEVPLPVGSWPRHADFHPSGKWLYGISELSSAVTVFGVDLVNGRLILKQTLSALPERYTLRSDASEIEVHPSGRFLYAANRGHDSIALFSINQDSGELSLVEWVSCGGKTPRFTTLSPDGTQFFSANEDSDTIQVFDVNTETGKLMKTDVVIETASPTCLCFA